MKNFLKRISSYGIANYKQACDILQASSGKSESDKSVVSNADRGTQFQSIEDRDAQFVLGYN